MVDIFRPPYFQPGSINGIPLAGAKLYFYATGTTTKITVYQDYGLTTPHANPVIADASGRFAAIYLNVTTYKIALYSAVDILVQTFDNISALAGASVVSIKDYGAVGDGVVDDAPALRLAVAAVSDGGTVVVPPGNYLLNSSVNSAIIDLSSSNKSVSIAGGGWNLNPGGTPKSSIFLMGGSIGDAVDFCHAAGTAQVTGVKWSEFAITAQGGFGGTRRGRNGLFVDASGSNTFYWSNFLMDHVCIDTMKTGKSVRTLAGAGSSSGGFAFSTLQNNYLSSTSFERCGDNVLLDRNIIGFEAQAGEGAGIYAYNIGGAANFVARNNVIANADGGVLIDGGVAPIIDFNEFEQVGGSTNTIGGQAVLRGTVSSITDPLVIGNSFSQLSAVAAYPNLSIATASGAMVSGNRMAKPTDGTTQIVVSAAATNTSIGENKYETAGVAVTTLAFLTDAGTNTRVLGSAQTYTDSVRFPSTPVLSSDVNTLDTYLEFAWTPTLVSAGGGTPTYGKQVGTGERIGRQYTLRFTLSITASNTLAAGFISIGGLPAAASSTTDDNGILTVGRWTGIGLDANYVHVGGIVAPGASQAGLFENNNATGTATFQLSVGSINTATFAINGMIQYHV